MLFNSFEFVLFFIVVYCAYRALSHKGQNLLLLAASYFFYGSWDWRFLLLLFASTVLDFYCAKRIHYAPNLKQRKIWLVVSLCGNLGILGFFKYFNFFFRSACIFLSFADIYLNPLVLHILLPIGVSFYTFQSISYIVDVYKNKLKPEESFFHYALFVSFFPQLVAGPIERAAHMLPQYKTPRKITALKNKEGLWFIYWGFFLKVFVADNMEKVVNLVFDQSGMIPGVEVVLGSYAFAFQVFGDFAGYSFIAMGVARLLGFDLMTNFLFPYFVTNPQDFWKHWHVSLSSWLRDYVYIPLGGSRHGEFKTYRNLLLTMFLGGLWHGAAWTFVIWGVYQGLVLMIHKYLKSVFPDKPNTPKRSWIVYAVQMIFMFQVTSLGWLIFRANWLLQLRDFTKSLIFNLGQHSDKAGYLAVQIAFYAALPLVIQVIQKCKNDFLAIPNLRGFRPWIFYGLMLYLILLGGEFGGKQFIYFQF